jgi:mRNA-degrading endonuclease RelE of RelBE toxin-antitoxin system
LGPVKWRVAWTERAFKDADRLDSKTRQRILAAIDRYATDEYGDVVRLEAMEPPEWRLRVGTLRVRFRRNTGERTLLILRVLPRDKAYR